MPPEAIGFGILASYGYRRQSSDWRFFVDAALGKGERFGERVMIEVQHYHLSERSARFVIASWWLAEIHIVDHFARVGFPIRIESVHEVGQLLNTMQERRFERFLTGLGGLSPAADKYLWARTEAVKFQLAHLPKRDWKSWTQADCMSGTPDAPRKKKIRSSLLASPSGVSDCDQASQQVGTCARARHNHRR
jgi:hypothetical protein